MVAQVPLLWYTCTLLKPMLCNRSWVCQNGTRIIAHRALFPRMFGIKMWVPPIIVIWYNKFIVMMMVSQLWYRSSWIYPLFHEFVLPSREDATPLQAIPVLMWITLDRINIYRTICNLICWLTKSLPLLGTFELHHMSLGRPGLPKSIW